MKWLEWDNGLDITCTEEGQAGTLDREQFEGWSSQADVKQVSTPLLP